MKNLFLNLLLSLVATMVVLGQGNGTDIFLKAIPSGFETVAVQHDDKGNTYVLGTRGSGGVVVRYDSTGNTTDADQFTIPSFQPVAFEVVPSENAIYVASVNSIRKFSINMDGNALHSASVPSTVRAIAYSKVNRRVIVAIQVPGSAIRLRPMNASNLQAITTATFWRLGWTGVSVRSIAVDEEGAVYMVGETGSQAGNPFFSITSGPSISSGGLSPSQRYLLKVAPNLGSFSTHALNDYNNVFDVTYSNGWVYLLGQASSGVGVRIEKRDNTLNQISRSSIINSADYANLTRTTPANMSKFSLVADSLDNVYITGYFKGGAANFLSHGETTNPFRSIASTNESAFVAKLDSNFEYQWVKSPIRNPLPTFGSHLSISWDEKNSRLWWTGSFLGPNGITMQEGADASTAFSLPQEEGNSQGFVSVFEPDGVFTEVVQFSVTTEYAANRVLLNGRPLDTPGRVLSLILDTNIEIQTPRIVYQWGGAPTESDGSRPNFETDNIDNKKITIDNADHRYSFINFSVNNVVQESGATLFAFSLRERTAVKLEWLVEYALTVDSNLDNTVSRATVPGGNAPLINALTSKAVGSPSPAVGKHWIEKDEPVVLEINGSYEDLSVLPGLPVRFVPWRYRLTGAAADIGTSSGIFTSVEPRQQLQEFTMSRPATVTYDWKLQYGVDMKTSNSAAGPDLVAEFIAPPPTPTNQQRTRVGTGVAWFDDGTRVRIGAPRDISTTNGPLILRGWQVGDGHIFSPSEDDFMPNPDNPFTVAQIDRGFKTYNRDGKPYYGLEIVLNRPASLVWRYGAKALIKQVVVGNALEFTDDEIERFEIRRNLEPAVASEVNNDDQETLEFIWDSVASKFFPLRNMQYSLLWQTTSGSPVEVIVNARWGVPNYNHIAGTPPVLLVPQPPPSQPRDLVFQRIAYTNADAETDDEQLFTATRPGRTVLEFNRITPAGRGGTPQAVVELRVVETKRWSTNLGPSANAVIGQKITSTNDRAGLGTGYVFFENARYNPFIYDRARFTGAALWDRANSPGPVIPVNLNPTSSPDNNDEFVVIWYDNPVTNDHILWPYKAERFNLKWPDTTPRILMSSGFGSESVGADGQDQIVVPETVVNGTTFPAATTFDPARFEQVQIYNQPVRNAPGYNPNEEHALIAPSLRFASVAPRPPAIYALRENDLNVVAETAAYTSDPYVLVQFFDRAINEFRMQAFHVVRADTDNYPNGFSTEMVAGEPVIPFYPLGVVSGATLCPSTYAREEDPKRRVFWTDHKNTAWAVSGDGEFTSFFYYPLSPNFWWPGGAKQPGDCVAWLPNDSANKADPRFDIDYSLPDETPDAQGVRYVTTWPLTVPTLKVGETLTFAGGEFAQDNPGNPGLPGVLAWAAGEVVFDDLNPDMREGPTDQDDHTFDRYTARMMSALEERTVSLPVAQFPAQLLPATGRVNVRGTIYQFDELSSSLKKRMFYNPLTGELGIRGFVNDREIGDPLLTASPPALYVLEPNVMTAAERDELLGVSEESAFRDLSGNSTWTNAVNALFQKSRNPNNLVNARVTTAGGYTVGLQSQTTRDPVTRDVTTNNAVAEPLKALGPGLALFTNPGFLDPDDDSLPDISYITLAENNDPELGGLPITLHVIKIDRRERYRGAVKVVLSDNVFDENIILRHSGDFGANPADLVFDWWYRVEDGTEAPPPNEIPAGQTNPWSLFPDPSGRGGQGFFQLQLKGNPQAPELLLADSLWFVRYRHKNEEPDNPVTWARNPEIPFEWAGAANSRPGDYRAQLAMGWVKRVLDAINPYEARIRDFTGDAPATYASMIRQFGPRYEGPVALNPAKDVIENVGLIELYSTVLNRARNLSIDLSTPVSTPGITNALLLASTRLADFYMLLGNEAYVDAKNPSIGLGTDSPELGLMAPAVFAFQNQLDSLLSEELALLRGVDDFKARPVYNRLFWNFTKGEGEAAYVNTYNISDVNSDGFINEDDAMMLYPQGHGDAWGHYLTAIGGQYNLLRNPFFNWVSRSELYALQGVVFEVDFLDERKFAQVAAAKAKAGGEIVNLTYRKNYVEDPESQWQGYLDANPQRAWGVEGWARRAGQGAYFDWVTANALIPSVHPNSSFTGIRKVDRTTVKDIAVVSANLTAVQQTFDEANAGYNPLGIAGNTVPFDIDPAALDGGSGTTHFEQIYERAVVALENAVTLFNNANAINLMLRETENDEIDFRRDVFEQDLAYRNELIGIFGSPYAGTIGAGRLYPAGYRGPDTSLYMYVDRQIREITARTVPGITGDFESDILAFTNTTAFPTSIGLLFGVTNDPVRAQYAPSFASNNPADWFTNWNDVNYITTQDNGITFNPETSRVPLQNVNLPIKASGYTFEAPAEWGMRASPGELQLHIASMIQQEAELAKAIAAWDGHQGALILQLRLLNAKIQTDQAIRGLTVGKIVNNSVLGAALVALDIANNAFEAAADLAENFAKIPKEFIPRVLPTAGFAFSPGDALSAAGGAAEAAALGLKVGFTATSIKLKGVSSALELTKDIIDMGLDLAIDDQTRNQELREALVELENMAGDEAILRVEIFAQLEALRALSEEYRAILQRGARLIDEREAFNKRVAELTQRRRYQDMSFRVSRNAAMQRYQESFDLAARYVYLAAKAYDYETNLPFNAPGSAQPILTEIVRERSLGYIDGGTPVQGFGGLAEHLARMKANFDVLKGQLGINNPQVETGRFSLRRELFRIAPEEASDGAWQDQLAMQRVANLWDMPEFRRYCRPFAPFNPAVPEPGIVIEFSSEILAGNNFFGRSLAGGDNAYDPTNFTTKISSVGAWFEGYVSEGFNTGLSETPRIYLVPVGSDVIMYPNDDNLGVRIWNVMDQKIPVPFPVMGANLDNVSWRPLDTLGGTMGEIRRFSSFRAYPDSGYFSVDEMTFDTRLVGRSVWNTRWMLIIPGRTLRADPDAALDTFIENITDIKLFFQTYGTSGN